jgi:hypothetical protein
MIIVITVAVRFRRARRHSQPGPELAPPGW